MTAALARLGDGERDAFDEVFRLARPLLERFASRAAPEDLDDLVQRTLVKAFEQCHRFDRSRSGATWLLTLAAWEARSLRRDRWRANRRSAGAVPESLASGAADPESRAELRELLLAVEGCLDALSPVDRATLEAHLMPGEGPAGATFRKRLERATRRFFTQWSREHGRDNP